MAFKAFFMTCSIAITVLGCVEQRSDEQEPALARLHAEQLLEHLRSEEWSQAADLVLVNRQALNRFALPVDTDRSVVVGLIEEMFREVYEGQPPGAIFEIRLNADGSGNPDRVFVTYRHGDFDSFYMRRIDDQWLYSFE